MTAEVGIRESRDHLSKYLDEVQQGNDVIVTDRGRAIAHSATTLDDLLDQVEFVEVDDAVVRSAGGLAQQHALRAYVAVHLAADITVTRRGRHQRFPVCLPG